MIDPAHRARMTRPDSPPSWRSGLRHDAVLSEHILEEVAEHYNGKFKASPDQVDLVVAALRSQSEMVTPADVPGDAFRDGDDLPILGTALAGHAECIVTGDRELLELGTYRGVSILSPRAFYDRVRD